MHHITRASLTVLSGAMLFSLATPLGANASPSSTTYLYNCSTRSQRPHEIILTCADANTYVTNIRWSHWSQASANARGTLHWNTCTPTCVAGTRRSTTINFVATHRRKVKGVWLYTELAATTRTWHSGSAVVTLPTSPL